MYRPDASGLYFLNLEGNAGFRLLLGGVDVSWH